MSGHQHVLTRQRAAVARGGFTVVELIVAMMIFTVGALAMAATATRVMTMMTSAQSRARAAAIAESRFERFRATPCSAHSSDSTTTRGVSERWTVVPMTRADDVTVFVSFAADHTTRTQVYRSFVPCY
jgi:prepilin-type N-terminal cleavage/methylation domain-containing protein